MEETFLVKSPKDCLISSYWSSQSSALICSIRAELKGENDKPIEVNFNIEDRWDVRKMIEDAFLLTLVENNPITKLIITFYIVVEGPDVFSCAINAFSCCAMLTGIKLNDTITSSTLLKGNSTSFVIYMLHNEKIIGFYLDGEFNKTESLNIITETIEGCKTNGEVVKKRIIDKIKGSIYFLVR